MAEQTVLRPGMWKNRNIRGYGGCRGYSLLICQKLYMNSDTDGIKTRLAAGYRGRYFSRYKLESPSKSDGSQTAELLSFWARTGLPAL